MIEIVLVYFGIPALIVVVYYLARDSKHKERMALIEKGLDPSVYMKEEEPYHKALMWGLLILGIGLGAFVGYILYAYAGLSQAYAVPTMALVFGGLGLIGFYVYRRKTETKTAD